MPKLPLDFYTRDNVVQIARDLLGKVLVTHLNGIYTSGRIVETEAYSGRSDAACHAHMQRKTKRTKVMFEKGGVAYVYLCYGIHNLFNIVTNQEGLADAVLIRAIEPMEGKEEMQKRRNKPKVDFTLTSGPGSLAKALGISRVHYGIDLFGNEIWIENDGYKLIEDQIEKSPRIGVDYAGEDAKLPWRFTVKDSKWVSK